jgi:hypothetical protein
VERDAACALHVTTAPRMPGAPLGRCDNPGMDTAGRSTRR